MILLLLLGCLDDQLAPGAGADTYIAMQADFAGFASWPSVTLSEPDSGHGAGERTVYLSRPEGAGETFPVSTVIVKVIEDSNTFAMARRGGDFNADGALGWEWFELDYATDGTPVIRWRGEEPPEGEAYGALPGQDPDTAAATEGDCNGCHMGARANDYVWSIDL